MSTITVYQDSNAQQVLEQSDEYAVIRELLAAVSIRFARWSAKFNVTADMDGEQILQAYSEQVDQLKAAEDYTTVDTISLASDNPMKDELRAKFLNEHTHSEDEVRFFVRGEGVFYLHIKDKVFMVHCCKGDLISVPANATHWFDMGPEPDFTAIRFFNNPEGWVANYTGSAIADAFPKFAGY